MSELNPLWIVFLAIGILSCNRTPNNDDEEQLPNILILYADDMGYGDLACQNPDSKIPTPNLDRLAAEGMRFTDAHSSSGICTPSRYALLTGRHHWRKFHGIVQAFGPSVFDDSRLTIAEMLRVKGYSTACVGKWHLGWSWDSIRVPGSTPIETEVNNRKRVVFSSEDFDWSRSIPGGPLDHGFDYYYGDDVINFPPYTWIENDKVLEPPTEQYFRGREETPEGNWECRPGPTVKDWDYYRVLPALTEKAVEYVHSRSNEDEPFFLYMAFPSPHAPIIPNKEFRGESEAGAYGDFVYQTDWCAGQILDALEEEGVGDNTLVIFTSDNGPEHYAYPRVLNYNHYSMGNLRGVKRDIWEGGHRVPFILKWPGHLENGKTVDNTISQVDIMTTIAEIVGYELRKSDAPDGFSLIPLLTTEEGTGYLRTATVQNTREGSYAIRKGKWLLIDHKTGNMNRPVPAYFDSIRGYKPHDLPGELYNLEEDPSQRFNLYEDQPEVVEELIARLQEIKETGY